MNTIPVALFDRHEDNVDWYEMIYIMISILFFFRPFVKILDYRFGLSGGEERTLEEVGTYFGVTRERVRQIQNNALGKLRKMIESLEEGKAA